MTNFIEVKQKQRYFYRYITYPVFVLLIIIRFPSFAEQDNRLLIQLASGRGFEEGPERRTGVSIKVHEDSSTEASYKLPAEVELQKRSNESSLKSVADIRKLNIIGKILIHKVSGDETFYDIARNYGVGIEELIHANPGVDPWIASEGTSIIIPSMHILPSANHKGIIINKAELSLDYIIFL